MRRANEAVTWLFWVLGATVAAAAHCTVSVHPYDEKGNRLDATLRDAVYLPDDDRQFVLPKLAKSRIRMQGRLLILPVEPDAGQPIQVVIEAKGRRRIVKTFEFIHCGQRFSFANGLAEEGNGEGFSFVNGGLTGCAAYEGWWVRMMPMFSFSRLTPIAEADVEWRSGRFTIQGFILGIRHVLVVGRGSEVVHAVGVNVVSGGTVAVPTVDVSGRCQGARTGASGGALKRE